MADVTNESSNISNSPLSVSNSDHLNETSVVSENKTQIIENDCRAPLEDEFENIQKNEENYVFGKNEKERKFRIFGIKFPGGWMDDEIISSILLKSESFYLNFNKTYQDEDYRQGDINVTFKTLSDAVQAYNILEKMTIDNVRLKVHASSYFVKAMTHFNNKFKEGKENDETLNIIKKPLFVINNEEQKEEFSKRLYAVDIPVSLSEEFIDNIIESSNIEDYTTKADVIPGGYLQAEIIFKNKYIITALIDEFRKKLRERDDSLKNTKILTSSEYLMYMSQRTYNDDVPIQSDATSLVKEFSVEEIAIKIEQYMMKRPINWREVDSKDDMYNICDTVSRQLRGLPDSLLKESMMLTLRRARDGPQLPLNKIKIKNLIKLWKQELLSDKVYDRPTKFKGSSANYIPAVDECRKKRKRNKKDKNVLKVQMGIGSFLQKAHNDNLINKYKDTEFEEEEEEEIEEPLLNENGEPLSFSAWSQISQNDKELGVVTMDPEEMKKYVKPLKKVIVKKKDTTEEQNNDALGEMNEEDRQLREDKEEGEVSTDESSSSDEEDLKRAKKKRYTKPTDGRNISDPIQSSHSIEERDEIGVLINKFYECRVHIIESLNERQKAGFLQYLKHTAKSDMNPQLVNKIFAELGNFNK
uniref:RRM domain-containing protein n=1 Tax=Strongyloides stercoralis TaxID=6248 RepID=A0A0K0E8R6_STRER